MALPDWKRFKFMFIIIFLMNCCNVFLHFSVSLIHMCTLYPCSCLWPEDKSWNFTAHPCLHCQLHTALNLSFSHPELSTRCINIQFCINDYYPASTKHFHDVAAMFWKCYRYDITFQQHYENTSLFAWVGCVFTKIMWLSADCPNLHCLNVKSWILTVFVV